MCYIHITYAASVSCSPGSSEKVTPATSPMSMTSSEPSSSFPAESANSAALPGNRTVIASLTIPYAHSL